MYFSEQMDKFMQYLRFFLFLGLILGGVEIIQGRTTDVSCLPIIDDKSSETKGSLADVKFKRVSFDLISVCVPAGFSFQERSGIDATYWTHSEEDVSVTIISGSHAPNEGGYAQGRPTFKKHTDFPDGVFATIWSYEDELKELRYVFGARFFVSGDVDGYAVTILMSSRRTEHCKILDKIISSFKLEKKPLNGKLRLAQNSLVKRPS